MMIMNELVFMKVLFFHSDASCFEFFCRYDLQKKKNVDSIFFLYFSGSFNEFHFSIHHFK